MVDNGDVRLLVTLLLSEWAHHGYEIMKTSEERVDGGYSPGPGVVDPICVFEAAHRD